MRRTKRHLFFIVRLSVSLGLIAYLVYIVDWGQMIAVLRAAALPPLLIIPVLLVARIGLASLRWTRILADSNVDFSFGQACSGYLIGACYDVFLPGVMGGDVVRVARCVRQSHCAIGTATASVLLERIAGVCALLSIALVVSIGFPATLAPIFVPEAAWTVPSVAFAGIATMTTLVLGRKRWVQWLPQWAVGRGWNVLRSGMQTLGHLRGRTLVSVLAISTLFQLTDIVVTLLLARSIGITVPPIVFFAIIPIVYIVTLLPISLGGLGVREGTVVFLLAQFGVVTSAAVTLSLLVYLCRIIVGGAGGIVQLIETVAKQETSGVADSAEPR